RAGSPSYVIFENQMTSVEIGLGTNPYTISDPRRSVESALDVRLRADEYSVADLEGFKMFEADGRADAYSAAEFSGDRSPDRATHYGIKFSFAVREPVILLDECFGTIGGAEMPGQSNFKQRVGHNFAPAVHRSQAADPAVRIDRHCCTLQLPSRRLQSETRPTPGTSVAKAPRMQAARQRENRQPGSLDRCKRVAGGLEWDSECRSVCLGPPAPPSVRASAESLPRRRDTHADCQALVSAIADRNLQGQGSRVRHWRGALRSISRDIEVSLARWPPGLLPCGN